MALEEVLVAVAVAVATLVFAVVRFVLQVRSWERRTAAAVTDADKRRLNPWFRTPEEKAEFRQLFEGTGEDRALVPGTKSAGDPPRKGERSDHADTANSSGDDRQQRPPQEQADAGEDG